MAVIIPWLLKSKSPRRSAFIFTLSVELLWYVPVLTSVTCYLEIGSLKIIIKLQLGHIELGWALIQIQCLYKKKEIWTRLTDRRTLCEDTETSGHTGGHHVWMEAELGVTHSKARDTQGCWQHQQLPKGWRSLPCRFQKEYHPSNPLILNFWPLELPAVLSH